MNLIRSPNPLCFPFRSCALPRTPIPCNDLHLMGKPTGIKTLRIYHPLCFPLPCFALSRIAAPYHTVLCPARRCRALHSVVSPPGMRLENPKPALLSIPLPCVSMLCPALRCPAVGGKPTGRSPHRRLNPLCFPLHYVTLLCPTVHTVALSSRCITVLCFRWENPPGRSLYSKTSTRFAFRSAALHRFPLPYIALLSTDLIRVLLSYLNSLCCLIPCSSYATLPHS